jgi:cobyrinic acid a,c-diamide synthase
MKAVIIAGTASGVGKTTVATGLMGALRQRGLKVQPFKTGPDYIDPTYHTWVTGVTSRNLDTWMLSRETVIELLHRAMKEKDIAVIEGVMGLFDGHSSTDDKGSTAELAKILDVPVVLVLDSRKSARSLAAMVHGYKTFDSFLRLGGVILNGIGSDGHLSVCRDSIEHYTGVKVVGYLPRREDLRLPERHLGLIPTVEGASSQEFLSRLIEQCLATFNLTEIIRIADHVNIPDVGPKVFPNMEKPALASIAVARDKAFSFYYQDSLDLLEAWGAELLPFSPLADKRLPEMTSGIYIGGGFPELYAAELAANESMKEAVRGVVRSGMPVYAECGGLMYLGTSLHDLQGQRHTMVAALPVSSQINNPELSLGYCTVKALNDGPLLRKGDEVRGHEFHWSVLEKGKYSCNAYRLIDREGVIEGFHQGNVLASYIHLHMASRPSMAQRFIAECERYRNKRPG